MNRLDDIRMRYAAADLRLFNAVMGAKAPPVGARGPITLEQHRDDINYVLGEIERLQQECAFLREWLRGELTISDVEIDAELVRARQL